MAPRTVSSHHEREGHETDSFLSAVDAENASHQGGKASDSAALSSIGLKFLYTGRSWHAAMEQYYYRARWYEPEAGRFLSRDPIGYEGGANQFLYAGSSPIVNTDPTGLKLKVIGDREFVDKILEQLEEITGASMTIDKESYVAFKDDPYDPANSKWRKGMDLILPLIIGEEVNTIIANKFPRNQAENTPEGSTILIDPKFSPVPLAFEGPNGTLIQVATFPWQNVAHELVHANQYREGKGHQRSDEVNTRGNERAPRIEAEAIGIPYEGMNTRTDRYTGVTENDLYIERRMPRRTHYGNPFRRIRFF